MRVRAVSSSSSAPAAAADAFWVAAASPEPLAPRCRRSASRMSRADDTSEIVRRPEFDRRRHRQQADLDGGHALLDLREAPALRPRERLHRADVLGHIVELPEAVVDAAPVGAVGRLAVLVAVDAPHASPAPSPPRRPATRAAPAWSRAAGTRGARLPSGRRPPGDRAPPRRRLPPARGRREACARPARRSRGRARVRARGFRARAFRVAEYQSLGTCPLAPIEHRENALLEREAIAPAVGHPRDGCRVVERVLQRGLREEAAPTAARSSPPGSGRTCAGPTRRGSRRSPPRRAPSVRGHRPTGRRSARRATRGAAA